MLAFSTGVALALLIMTATAFGAPGQAAKYLITAVVCSALFVAFNGWMNRLLKRPTPQPMIHPASAASAVWAGLFPLVLIIAAAAPVFSPGHDYGLLILIASVWFGVTVDSAIRANRI
jgi:uncharacterized iron-regulated membrane protein